jgi:translation initiation factor IF-2
MGHIDHGKSTLLDFIRKSKVVEGEAGGITQHLSAYEVTHTAADGSEKPITFLDTPGHEAFQKMRQRGSAVADIAILVVSAEDGVKPQTLEAHAAITETNTPFVVAINKIDRPNADPERTKGTLLEHGIYLEGMGGDVPYAAISAKEGTGVPELLDVLLLLAEFQELTAEVDAPATGVVIEANRDPKKGVAATLLIKNGTLESGAFVVAGGVWAPVRIMEDFQGEKIDRAGPSRPVAVVGFSDVPAVGATFVTVGSKKEAEALAQESARAFERTVIGSTGAQTTIPLYLKADAQGSLDAIEHELGKLEHERIAIAIVGRGVGAITEGDVKSASISDHALIAGFHTPINPAARELAERMDLSIGTFDIIYELAEWLEAEIKKRTPTQKEKQTVGRAKVLRIFSTTKDKQIIGGRIEEGTLSLKGKVRIVRRGERVGEGTITSLQQGKSPTTHVQEGEFGAQVESRIDVAEGDTLEPYQIVET